jgi:transcription elongation factor GreA
MKSHDGDQQLLTKEKYDELVEELNHLKTVRRTEIAESLEYARSLGDLSENAEYQEARELQAATEERIRKLEELLKTASVISGSSKDGAVNFGSVVKIKKSDGEERGYTIVGSEEADMRERKISHVSPLGSAMMGKKKGESFTFETPTGTQTYTITGIS